MNRDYKRGDRSDSDSDAFVTPRDDRFFTPRLSARLGGSSSDGEWATPRSNIGPGWASDEGEYSTPRDQQYENTYHPPPASKVIHVASREAKHGGCYEEKWGGDKYHNEYHAPQQPPAPNYYQDQAAGHDYHAQALPQRGGRNFEHGSQDSYVSYSQQSYPEDPAPYAYDQPPSQYDQQFSQRSSYDHHATAPTQPHYDPAVDYAAPKDEGGMSAGEQMDRAVEDIFSCARHNRVEEVERLLDKGLPPNVRDQYGNTILAISCQNGNKRVAKAALRRGADINARNYKGNTPLHFCFTYGYGDSLGQYLISKGADPSIRNNTGLSCYEGVGR